MEEIGKIVEAKGNKVKVELVPKGGCPHCPVKMFCFPGADKRYIEVLSGKKVKVGDTVSVEMNPKRASLAAFLLFILPITAFILAFAIANLLTRNQNVALVVAIFIFFGSIGGLGRLDKKISKGQGFKPVVKQVINEKR